MAIKIQGKSLDLSLLTPAEQQFILRDCNATQSDYPKEICLHQLIEAQAELTPERIAVSFEGQKLTYQELNQRANQLAHHLITLGVSAEVLVGICLDRGVHIAIALLGVLKAGGAYIPLDPEYPSERLAFMVQDSELSVLVTEQSLLTKLEHQVKVVDVECSSATISQYSPDNPTCRTTSQNLAYTIYTSGSTGKPKGVQILHQAVVNFLYSMRQVPGFTAEDIFLGVTTICFDIAGLEIFLPLIVGGQVALVSRKVALDGARLSAAITESGATVIQATPATWQLLLATGWQGNPQLKILCGGEAMTGNLAKQLLVRCASLWNMYGPTETTIWSAIHQVTSPLNAAPIGRPIANTQIYLLSITSRRSQDSFCPVALGTPGEVYISGDGLARGYLNRPELSNERFVPNPFSEDFNARLYKTGDLARYRPDGTLEFIGRVDNQVKIRGFRIELGDIEAALSQHPSVREAAVIAQEDNSLSKRLIAYVTPHTTPEVAFNENSCIDLSTPTDVPERSDCLRHLIPQLRTFLKQKLPDYMVPAIFVVMDSLPLTPNGKIDRRALPEPDRARPFLETLFVSPRNLVEQQLVNIWSDVLGVEPIGIHDNFFELGGNSLLTAQLVSQIQKTFQVKLPLDYLFQNPTVEGLGQFMTMYLQDESSHLRGLSQINLHSEAILDAGIKPEQPFIGSAIPPNNIFLTGATGFLGAFLLHELLQQTQADIYCLVRAANPEAARQKILSNLERYSLNSNSYNTRIFIVLGDIEKPFLGLSSSAFKALASKIDTIFHNGAYVNLIYPYSALWAANVFGTQEVLRLAALVKVKPVHFVSTLDVMQSTAHIQQPVIWEMDNLESFEGLDNGYAQSKWVAEKLVIAARDRGIPTCIYRPGTIVGHSQTGASRTDDVVCRIIKGLIQMGSAPKLDVNLSLTPVDYVSQAIVHLSQQSNSLDKAFHLVTPHVLSWDNFVDYIQAARYPLKRMIHEQWQFELMRLATKSTNALHPFIDLFTEKQDGQQQMKALSLICQAFDCQNTISGLIGTEISCPPIDSTSLQVYFSYFIESGFLEAPIDPS